VEISTQAAIKKMVVPGLLAVLTPVVVGFAGGAEMLGGLLAGVTVTGGLMAVFQANAGGAWDNAKKMFESGFEVNGEKYFKGSDPHKAAVVGDTVGDPFKDTSGPSMNILIKLTCLIGLVMAPILGSGSHTVSEVASCCITKEKCITMSEKECHTKESTNLKCEHTASYEMICKEGTKVASCCDSKGQCEAMSAEECKEKGCSNLSCEHAVKK
jgi:K(+)-stimulated pyrophosphate-energized sodium pump